MLIVLFCLLTLTVSRGWPTIIPMHPKNECKTENICEDTSILESIKSTVFNTVTLIV